MHPSLKVLTVTALALVALALATLQTTGAAAQDSAPPPSQPTPHAVEAIGAYRAAMAALNRRDLDAYAAAFASPVQCFFGMDKPDAAALKAQLKKQLEGTSAYTGQLEVVSTTAAEVHLIDRGIWTREIDADVHEKAVLMRRGGQGWQIAGIASLGQSACLGPGFKASKPSAQVKKCRSAARACEARCEADYHNPGNAWLSCRAGCSDALAVCMQVDVTAP